MSTGPGEISNPAQPKRRGLGRLVRIGCWGCFGTVVAAGILVVIGVCLISKVPKTYPGVANPIAPPVRTADSGGGLPGFDSPYLGHTGSWNGKGGTMTGASKEADLDAEAAMGLQWTFMPVYWRAMEPSGPVNLGQEIPEAWKQLDRFVCSAEARHLNILLQAPVMGGNATGPPDWAGRREPGKSAPLNMEAAGTFAAKLAERYGPAGTLAKERGWTNYGVRAWELDNEPESYRTHWKGQACDYAEFATVVAAAIKRVDPKAVIVLPGVAGGPGAIPWLEEALDPNSKSGSGHFRNAKKSYSIGPIADVVSFHCYEGLETGFTRTDRTVERDFSDIRAIFEKWENRNAGFHYSRKEDYWHTEGNFDFLGVLSANRRAAWRFQFLARGFAAGIRKLMIMDASEPEQKAVKAFVTALPNPFPMVPATGELIVTRGQAVAFKHLDGSEPDAGTVWVVWAVAGTGPARIDISVHEPEVTKVGVDGKWEVVRAANKKIGLELPGDSKMAAGFLVIDRPSK